MDIAKEFAVAQKRLDRNLERNCLIALARIDGITPEEYAAKVDAERAAIRSAVLANSMEQMGASLRAIRDTYVSMIENFAKGWNAAGRK